MFKSKSLVLVVVYCYTVLCCTSAVVPQEPFKLVRPKKQQSPSVTVDSSSKYDYEVDHNTGIMTVTEADPNFSLMETPKEIGIPSISIKGAESPIQVGELVQLWVEIEDVDESLHSVNYAWTVLPSRNVTIWPDGSRILFGTGTQHDSYIVVLTASFVFTECDEEDTILSIQQKAITLQHTVQIVGAGELAEEPKLKISLSLDEPKLDVLGGMAKNSYDWVKSVERTTDYTDADVKRDASKLFASFTSVSSDIESDSLTDLNAVLNATMIRNVGVLSNKEAWRPWFNDMSSAIEDVYDGGGLRDLSEVSSIWQGIAQGLNEASK